MILTLLFLINWSVLDLPGRDQAQLDVPLGAFQYQEPSRGRFARHSPPVLGCARLM